MLLNHLSHIGLIFVLQPFHTIQVIDGIVSHLATLFLCKPLVDNFPVIICLFLNSQLMENGRGNTFMAMPRGFQTAEELNIRYCIINYKDLLLNRTCLISFIQRVAFDFQPRHSYLNLAKVKFSDPLTKQCILKLFGISKSCSFVSNFEHIFA